MPQIVSKTIQLHIAFYNQNLNDLEYLALKRKDTDKLYPSIWQVVTGTIEENENSMDTAKRELIEETSLQYSKFYSIPYITKFYDSKLDAVQFAPVFGVLVNSKEVLLSDEHSEFKWLSFEEHRNLLTLPTHKEGANFFKDYVLDNPLSDMFLKSQRLSND